jgi:hypothetical protein
MLEMPHSHERDKFNLKGDIWHLHTSLRNGLEFFHHRILIGIEFFARKVRLEGDWEHVKIIFDDEIAIKMGLFSESWVEFVSLNVSMTIKVIEQI